MFDELKDTFLETITNPLALAMIALVAGFITALPALSTYIGIYLFHGLTLVCPTHSSFIPISLFYLVSFNLTGNLISLACGGTIFDITVFVINFAIIFVMALLAGAYFPYELESFSSRIGI